MTQDSVLEILTQVVASVKTTNEVIVAEMAPGYYLGPNERLILTPKGLMVQQGIYSVTDEESYWQKPELVEPSHEIVTKFQLTEEALRKL